LCIFYNQPETAWDKVLKENDNTENQKKEEGDPVKPLPALCLKDIFANACQ
jgi:hypothetical protein